MRHCLPGTISLRCCIVLLFASSFPLVPCAKAAVVSGSFAGIVTSDSNADGVFGLSPGALIGMPLSGSFSYDTTLLSPPAHSSPATYWWYNASPAVPTLSMTTTINGVSFTYNSGYFGVVFTNHDTASVSGNGDGEIASPWQEFGIEVCNFSTYNFVCGWFDVGAQSDAVHIVGDPSDPAVAFTLRNIPLGDGIGGGSSETGDCPGPLCGAEWGFSITSITVQAPEPISIALFGTGLAGLGMLRRTKSAPPA